MSTIRSSGRAPCEPSGGGKNRPEVLYPHSLAVARSAPSRKVRNLAQTTLGKRGRLHIAIHTEKKSAKRGSICSSTHCGLGRRLSLVTGGDGCAVVAVLFTGVDMRIRAFLEQNDDVGSSKKEIAELIALEHIVADGGRHIDG
jgi:hypothetical protein